MTDKGSNQIRRIATEEAFGVPEQFAAMRKVVAHACVIASNRSDYARGQPAQKGNAQAVWQKFCQRNRSIHYHAAGSIGDAFEGAAHAGVP